MINNILHGKNPTKGVVGIEVEDGNLYYFVNTPLGVVSTIKPYKYWLLSNRKFKGEVWATMNGRQHYQYGRRFASHDEFKEMRKDRYSSLWTINNLKEQAMVYEGITYYKGMDLADLSVLSFDLETTGLDPNAPDALIVLISLTHRSKSGIVKKLFCYDEYQDQGEMIKAFCLTVRELNPMVIIGHNINGFDLNYLKTIAYQYNTDLYIGRNGKAAVFEERPSKFRKEATQFIDYHKCHIFGREVIDTLFLSIKHDVASRKYVSYGLKQIIKQEGLEKPRRVMYDAASIRHNYKNPEEMVKIKAYCADDADDALALFDLMIPSQFFIATYISKTLQGIVESASGSQLNNLMVRSYLQIKHSIPKATDAIKFEGAISFGIPGVYKNAFKVDVASLYPSIMLEYNIYDKVKDPNKHLLILLDTLRTERLKNKELGKTSKTRNDLQNAQKILINSLYGFLGASGLNYNSPENAALVTKHGREILKKAILWATGKEYEGKGNDDENEEL